MATVKLTSAMRRTIVGRALRHRFSAEVADLRRRLGDHALEVYRDVYGAATIQRMDDLPTGWLEDSSSIDVRLGDEYVKAYFDGDLGRRSTLHHAQAEGSDTRTRRRRVMHRHEHGCAKTYEASHPLAISWGVLKIDRARLEERVKTADKALEQAVGSVYTIGRLLAEWPELEPFCAGLAPPPAVPTVSRSSLNAILDLPVG